MLHTFQMILKRKGRWTEAAQGRRASLALSLVLLLLLPACNHHDSGLRKHYSAYDKMIDVKQDIREMCPSLSISSVEGALRKLVAAGELKREGAGKSICYYRLK